MLVVNNVEPGSSFNHHEARLVWPDFIYDAIGARCGGSE
jgi:hypothetical protein